MKILTIRTDKPEAEIGLFNDSQQLDLLVWYAHRELAETIHIRIKDILEANSESLETVQGIVLYRGPGSFTGLRIGTSVANALAASLGVPIIGAVGDNWLRLGVVDLLAGKNDRLVIPEYGSEPHITLPRK
jgi:tRNA threonylcarbamoyladenosine biosynthesis protein TsaB